MTKSDTRQLKGLAILMMLWLHLFSYPDTVRQCSYWLSYINGQPLAYALTRLASSCVPIYIFLGGYGLAATYRTSQDHRLHGGRRALALMTNFWLICLIFIPIGCMVNPEVYPGSWKTLLLNVTALAYSYNGAWWFLLPYVLLTLTAHYLISHYEQNSRQQDMVTVAVLAVVYVGVYLLKSVLPLSGTWPLPGVLPLLNYMSMLLLFTLGILAVKYRLLERERIIAKTANRKWVAPSLLLILCLLKMLLGSSSLLNVPFVLLLIPLLLSLRWPQWLLKALEFLGLHSTNMWLIHYFFYYMFGHLIYGLRYPLLIYVVLVAVSLACSMLVRPVFEPLRKKIRETPSSLINS
jgi:hypothetical protein